VQGRRARAAGGAAAASRRGRSKWKGRKRKGPVPHFIQAAFIPGLDPRPGVESLYSRAAAPPGNKGINLYSRLKPPPGSRTPLLPGRGTTRE
jgi:hypothetical protein